MYVCVFCMYMRERGAKDWEMLMDPNDYIFTSLNVFRQ